MQVFNYLVLERDKDGNVSMKQFTGNFITFPMEDFEYVKLEDNTFIVKPINLDIELMYDLDQFDDLDELQAQVLKDIYMREISRL